MVLLNPAFSDFPEEEKLIGRMVIAYGEFEIMLAISVAAALDTDPDDIYRAFFRVYSPGSRIAFADAILRTPTQKLGLTDARVHVKTAVKHCMLIRNQYAHAQWINSETEIGFLNVEKAANADGGFLMPKHFIALSLIQEQHDYFRNCRDWLFYLEHEIKRLRDPGNRNNLVWKRPLKLPKPNLFNPPATPLPQADEGDTSCPEEPHSK